MKRKILIFLVLVFIFFILLSYYFLGTPFGSNLLVKFVLSMYLKCEEFKTEEYVGSLLSTFKYKKVFVKNIQNLPDDSYVNIQELSFKIEPLVLKFKVNINNGRINFNNLNFIFWGSIENNKVNINIFSENLYLDFAGLVPSNNLLNKVTCKVKGLDSYISGVFNQLQLKGKFKLDTLQVKNFSLVNSQVDFQFTDIHFDKAELLGEIFLKGGEFKGLPKAIIKLKRGEVIFKGEFKDTNFDLEGYSQIDGTKVRIDLKGDLLNPQILLSSEPSLPKEYILAMLLTGKDWSSLQEMDRLSLGDILKEFIDYSVGSDNKFFKELINLFSWDNDTQKIQIKKEIDKVSIGLESTKKDNEVKKSSTIKGEYKLNDMISIGVEKEIKVDGEQTDKTTNNDKITIQLKKEF